jgi:hypothetical protein
MQLPAVQVLEKLFNFTRLIHVFKVRKQIHVPKGIDGD